MQNVAFTIEEREGEHTLIIRVNLNQRFGPSKSGKTQIVASTGGFTDTGLEGVRFGLNVVASKPR